MADNKEAKTNEETQDKEAEAVTEVQDKEDKDNKIHSFGDFAEHKTLTGDKVAIESILNKRILVLAFEVRDSKYQSKGTKNCTKVQFKEAGGDEHVFFTGSEVLKDQLETYRDQLPFWATVEKVTNYYTFS